MIVGILQTGVPPPELEPRFGRYDAMFGTLLGSGFSTRTYDVQSGELPEDAADHPAYIVTGSPAGVYDDLPWIAPLKTFLQQAKGKAKLIGICFGHQIMAEAFGGRVEKSDRGWGVGLQRYHVHERAPWMGDLPSFAIPISHQDQIVRQPPNSRALAGSDFNRFGLIAYDDQPAISFQCHPEFSPEFAKALIETRKDRLPDPDAALASLDAPNDRGEVADWIRSFLRSSKG